MAKKGRPGKLSKLKTLGYAQAGIAHKIKNPLVSIGGFARRIEKGLKKLPNAENGEVARLAAYAETVVKEVQKIETLLKKVEEYLKPCEPRLAKINLNNLIRSTLKTETENRQIRARISFAPGKIPCLTLDPNHIHLVICELIENALGETATKDEIWIKTYERICRKSREVVLEVKNSGSFIPEDELDLIFTPFYTTKSGKKGWGLGLALVQAMLEANNAAIAAKSKKRPPETTFTIKFKLG